MFYHLRVCFIYTYVYISKLDINKNSLATTKLIWYIDITVQYYFGEIACKLK